MKDLIVYVHGKGGSSEEAEHYKPLFPESEVIGYDYLSQTPWEAKEEFPAFFAAQRQRCDHIILIANSIGAYFSLSALGKTLVDGAYFISPVVDMETLISTMMRSLNVTEAELSEKGEIATDFGETLSWRYLCYVREHPGLVARPHRHFIWRARQFDFDGDDLGLRRRHNARLTVMPGGEHWFHTAEQMHFLDDWLRDK